MSTKVDDRQTEAVGEFHQPDGFAIALGPRHAEIMLDCVSVSSPFVAETMMDPVAELHNAADASLVLGGRAVARERCQILDQATHEVHGECLSRRPLAVTVLSLVGVDERRLGLLLELCSSCCDFPCPLLLQGLQFGNFVLSSKMGF